MTEMPQKFKVICDSLIAYILETYPSTYDAETIPLDDSLVGLGVLDSYAVVELVAHIEGTWDIAILDADITREKFGSINKMAALIIEKTHAKATGPH